ncbi:RNA-directed DNA polymerase, eukaryota [Tanacetum coccineum]
MGLIESTMLSNSEDRWVWDLNGDGVFRVKDVRNLLDETFLPKADTPTRWIKCIPIKVNVFVWKALQDRLPTRTNLVRRNILVDSLSCPICDGEPEDSSHLFFRCCLARDVTRLVCRWWDLDFHSFNSYTDWQGWFKQLRLGAKSKEVLEVCMISLKSIRQMIDANCFPVIHSATRWVKFVPLKLARKISSWWNVDYVDVSSYEEWYTWLVSLRLQANLKAVFEGIFYCLWWSVWMFRNKILFEKDTPSQARIFDNIVSNSYYWFGPPIAIAKPNDLVQLQHLEETTFHKSNKVEETEARVEATMNKENATTEKEKTIKETADTLTSLQSEVASLEAKRSLDANEEVKKDHTRVHELEKQEEKLLMELQLNNNFREALETKDLKKKTIDLNTRLHDLQEVKTRCALKIDDEI